MKYSVTVLSACALVASAGVASAQTVWVSGLSHRALGTATFGPPVERRLPVNNLGSSGQDGVEVKFRTAAASSFSVDITPLLSPSSSFREIRVRPKGWDGTIKGNIRLISPPGTTGLMEVHDFSSMPGVAAVHWRLMDALGNELASGTHPGPVLDWTLGVADTGTTCNKVYSYARSSEGSAAGSSTFAANQGFFDRVVSVGGVTPVPVTGVQQIEVTPVPCAGCVPPPWIDLDSAVITTLGLPSLTVLDALLASPAMPGSGGGGGGAGGFIRYWGLSQAQIAEITVPDLDGDGAPDRAIHVSNLGSSGQDGVSIDLFSPFAGGASNGGATFSISTGCCRGHVTILKLHDMGGSESCEVTQSSDPIGPENSIVVDASAVGSPECTVQFRDVFGNAVMTRALPPGEPVFYTACPDTEPFERWEWAASPDTGEAELRFYGCGTTDHFRLADGIFPPDAVMCAFKPSSASWSVALGRCTITGTGLTGMTVAQAAVFPPGAPPCDPDVNQDGNVDQDDITYLINVVGGGDNSTGIDPDFNHDGNVDQDDVLALLNVVAGGPCP